MKNSILILTILFASILNAQSFNFKFDHQAIIVDDIKVSGDFYANILNLEEISHPDKKPGFRWFIVNGNSQVHLIEKDGAKFKKNKSMHLCLATQSLDAVVSHLEKNKIPYYDWPGKENAITLRADGVHQIYIQDPDDYWIEINDAKH